MEYVRRQALQDGRNCFGIGAVAALLTTGALHFGLGNYAKKEIDPSRIEYQIARGQEIGGAVLGALGLGAAYASRRISRRLRQEE